MTISARILVKKNMSSHINMNAKNLKIVIYFHVWVTLAQEKVWHGVDIILSQIKGDRRISRGALLKSAEAPFSFVHISRYTASMITLTGLDYTLFRHLLEKLEPIYSSYTHFTKSRNIKKLGPKCGRPSLPNANSALGLNLAWYKTRGSMMVLSLRFGKTGSTFSIIIRFVRRILLQVLLVTKMRLFECLSGRILFILSGSNCSSSFIN